MTDKMEERLKSDSLISIMDIFPFIGKQTLINEKRIVISISINRSYSQDNAIIVRSNYSCYGT